MRLLLCDAADEDEALFVGHTAHGIDDCRPGLLPQQPKQQRPGLVPAPPAERAGRLHRDNVIRIVEQLDQERNGCRRPAGAAACAGADLGCGMPQQRDRNAARKADPK